jgi:hypothetical protein
VTEFERAMILFQRAQMQLLIALCRQQADAALSERTERIAKALDEQLRTFAPNLDV